MHRQVTRQAALSVLRQEEEEGPVATASREEEERRDGHSDSQDTVQWDGPKLRRCRPHGSPVPPLSICPIEMRGHGLSTPELRTLNSHSQELLMNQTPTGEMGQLLVIPIREYYSVVKKECPLQTRPQGHPQCGGEMLALGVARG